MTVPSQGTWSWDNPHDTLRTDTVCDVSVCLRFQLIKVKGRDVLQSGYTAKKRGPVWHNIMVSPVNLCHATSNSTTACGGVVKTLVFSVQ